MINQETIKNAMEEIIEAIGEDIQRDGLKNTPKRVAKMFSEVFAGLDDEPQKYMETIFDSDYKDLILVKDIKFYSMCEHHFLPFFGTIHIAYIPQNGVITGLSKLVRVVECISKRPQIQENLTVQIADVIMDCLKPYGVMVIVEAEHMCMSMRGVENPGTHTVTFVAKGIFQDDSKKREEVFSLIKV